MKLSLIKNTPLPFPAVIPLLVMSKVKDIDNSRRRKIKMSKNTEKTEKLKNKHLLLKNNDYSIFSEEKCHMS